LTLFNLLASFVRHWKMPNMETSNHNADTLDPLLTLQEVGRIIGRSVREVWREISRGKFPRPVPGRPARLFRSDVHQYLHRLRDERDKLPGNEKEKS
jgi:predicted DNA-binding transcriptional regulator AlpA